MSQDDEVGAGARYDTRDPYTHTRARNRRRELPMVPARDVLRTRLVDPPNPLPGTGLDVRPVVSTRNWARIMSVSCTLIADATVGNRRLAFGCWDPTLGSMIWASQGAALQPASTAGIWSWIPGASNGTFTGTLDNVTIGCGQLWVPPGYRVGIFMPAAVGVADQISGIHLLVLDVERPPVRTV